MEILKALYRDARVLVLDEPTAVLTPQESDTLFATLKKLAADGLAIIFISHKLAEVIASSHRVAVLRADARWPIFRPPIAISENWRNSWSVTRS